MQYLNCDDVIKLHIHIYGRLPIDMYVCSFNLNNGR